MPGHMLLLLPVMLRDAHQLQRRAASQSQPRNSSASVIIPRDGERVIVARRAIRNDAKTHWSHDDRSIRDSLVTSAASTRNTAAQTNRPPAFHNPRSPHATSSPDNRR